MIVTHGKIYETCAACGKLVRLNKPVFGSMHLCATEEEQAIAHDAVEAQRHAMRSTEDERLLRLLQGPGLGWHERPGQGVAVHRSPALSHSLHAR
jgi:hypothetical protein